MGDAAQQQALPSPPICNKELQWRRPEALLPGCIDHDICLEFTRDSRRFTGPYERGVPWTVGRRVRALAVARPGR